MKLSIAAIVLLLASMNLWAQGVTPSGIELDREWKVHLNEFAKKNLVHQSWGYPHAERNYHLSLKLAEAEGVIIDKDVLFAVAFLHDQGGLPPYEKPGVDHGVRSAEIARPLLLSFGFPEEKLDAVLGIIIEHVYYGPRPYEITSQIFRDADMLDFLGNIGVARILAANLELGKTPAIENSTNTMKALMDKIQKELVLKSSKREAIKRFAEMRAFLKSLDIYTISGRAL